MSSAKVRDSIVKSIEHGFPINSAKVRGSAESGTPFVACQSMLQLNPPLVRVVVGGPGWIGPTGKGVANLIEPGHRDDDLVWIIDMDENGETWCVPNRYVRAPRNITYGRAVNKEAANESGSESISRRSPAREHNGR